ncbi:ABC transporter ATP-binding protein [Pelagibius sp.]|uniref:ABC transporter ATP-binding protein n=1 Tax=Pelagibius sp. TaxID=1931238 RepID=UPI003B512354
MTGERAGPTGTVSGTGLAIRRVTKVFDAAGSTDVRAVDDLSLEIGQNEFFTLLGPSGCGKTTLLRMIAGLEQPTAGEVLLDGEPLQDLPPYRRPINTVFQSYALFPHMSVGENIAFGLKMRGLDSAIIARKVDEVLALVRLEGLAERRPAQLSGGQQQRVALARALANEPKILLLDEPLSALDLKLRKQMRLELKRLQKATGITFIFVTHDQEEALIMSDRVAVLSEGRVLQLGPPEEIYRRPRSRFVADFIGDTNIILGHPKDAERLVLGGAAELRFAAAVLPTDGRDHALSVAIRPESCRLVNGAAYDDLANVFDGRVREIEYLGADTCVLVDVEALGASITVRLRNTEGGAVPPREGETVRVSLPAAALWVLEP